nr:methyltransferase domain-containing protein [Aquimarina sp. RZ0]
MSNKVLHFSPSRCLYRRLKQKKGLQYYSSDFENEFIADHHYDITKIPVEDNFFDFIICYHILERIQNDKLAIQELYRVLKTNGTILIQTPFKDGQTYENDTITSPEDRLKHFGQEDHCRIYSAHDLKKRLEATNFAKIKIREFSNNDKNDIYGLKATEAIIEVIK